MPVQLRSFHPDDRASVEFIVMSVLQEWGFLPSARDVQELDALQSQSPFEVFYVAEDDMVGVVGCAGVAKVDDTTCELRKIYLLKKFRGTGLGKQLLTSCVEYAKQRGYQTLKFEANATVMADSEQFYLNNGFVLYSKPLPTQNGGVSAIYHRALNA